LLDKAAMIPHLNDPIAILQKRLNSDASRHMIALAGVPGSGKSTIAARLGEEMNARCGEGTLLVLGMDGFHLPKAALRQMPDPDLAFARRGAPWTFDALSLAERLRALRHEAGRAAVPWPDFQHDVGDPVEGALEVPPQTCLILVEGLYLLHNEDGWENVSSQFDERWFLDTPLEIALERLVHRHMAAWGMTREQATARIASNDRLNAELVQRSRANADWLMDA